MQKKKVKKKMLHFFVCSLKYGVNIDTEVETTHLWDL